MHKINNKRKHAHFSDYYIKKKEKTEQSSCKTCFMYKKL